MRFTPRNRKKLIIEGLLTEVNTEIPVVIVQQIDFPSGFKRFLHF